MNAQESAGDEASFSTELSTDDARVVLKEWVETQRLIAEERRNWKLGKQSLTDSIALVRDEIETLSERKQNDEASIVQADSKRTELLARNTELKEASGSLVETISGFEITLKELIPGLPNPLAERLAPIIQSLPEDSAETDQTLSERFLSVIGILQEVDKFNGEIHVVSEVRDLGNGNSAEVAVMYLGIGMAFYATTDETAGGYGIPTKEGWVWTADNDIAPQVALSIAIQRNEAPAAYVKLPVSIK